ncbi:tetratricopeptide repeat protein [Micromonospora sp. CA-111912]|uniref:tetratricopeptide repeat protein n=1 Tax=Micromonospora sp. CA-111912 TaxID=3239955 RepID=UPI003D8ED283
MADDPAGSALQKALLLLDHGRAERAESILRGILDETSTPLWQVRARVVLGEHLNGQGRHDEALAVLAEVPRLGVPDADDDVVAYEIRRAGELLARLRGA